ncbi:zinc-ribbon domain containing protein [Piscinibacter defluvii]|uniref:zinc-ribbon domain containing protein n=1 Tax=Piscinibacter defluvii TaxID=1796922 RepID=UPI000FDD0D21|nr:zinc-ribbon domain containing protein [Piscinibacter defluvii]
MKRERPARPPILERRRLKRGARAAEVAQELERERAKAQRELAKKHVLVNPDNLCPNNSYDTPDFVKRGYYVDRPFTCKSCGVSQVWTETQQKWWYESAKGDVWAVAVLCRPCRRREQARRAAAREVHLSGLASKRRNAA